jgi:mRNA interferase MazF
MWSCAQGNDRVTVLPLAIATVNIRDRGEFRLTEWRAAGLNVPTAVKRGLYTVHETLIVKTVGRLTHLDAEQLERLLPRHARRPALGA